MNLQSRDCSVKGTFNKNSWYFQTLNYVYRMIRPLNL